MAKKIRLDFSKTEDRASWNSKHMPAGLYKAEIATVEETTAKDGTDMLIYGFRPSNPKYKTRNFPYYCKLQANQLWKLRDLFIAAGQTVPKKAVTLDPNKIVGKIVAIELEDDTYDGKIRSVMEGVYDATLVEEEELAADEDSDIEDDLEDNEDFDEDDFEDDLEDDLEDSEDDEDDEDGFDEDDLDYDEEEDEDDLDEEEEEEEEPEPVKKPVKKTPKRRVIKK